MAKTIRPTYPKELSIGLLILIFVLSAFLSTQIFNVTWRQLMEGTPVYIGLILVGFAVVVMVLVIWEEFLFPVHVKPTADGVTFRNHRNKLWTQLLIYFLIPAIFAFVYSRYEVNITRFTIWAGICIIFPIVGKLISGVKNYNDFLTLRNNAIEYKNNQEKGGFALADITSLMPVRDDNGTLHKLRLSTTAKKEIMIDLDEMELDPFLDEIDKFIQAHYGKYVVNSK